MIRLIRLYQPVFVFLVSLCMLLRASVFAVEPAPTSELTAEYLRCEYLENPLGIDQVRPRLSWRLRSDRQGVKQVAYQIRVASSAKKLSVGDADLWDSGRVASDQSLFVEYSGVPLSSGRKCFWNVSVWAPESETPVQSETASWTMGLLDESDWSADYISYQDPSPVFDKTDELLLPAARQYRRPFDVEKKVVRATVYATALGIYELHLNGERVGDAYFAPGWTDYLQRAYYNTYDVTDLVQEGENVIGGWVADGWYAGYVGFGLLTGMSTEKTGRAVYGKTPSWMAQLEIEYSDGTKKIVGTDASWKVTGEGAIQVADLLMGEEYDARKEWNGWSQPGFDDSSWDQAILAEDNGQPEADFYQFANPSGSQKGVTKQATRRKLGFHRPRLEAFPGVPVRIIEELPAKTVTQIEDDAYIFDLGQNFAGVIRLKLSGQAGQRVRIRYGEMLHPDGRLMTENLRKARATDYFTFKGKGIETYQPRFTFHGFQYVELKGISEAPTLDAVTGLAMHSDTPMVSTFECNDPMVNQLFSNISWTQRANFLDLPTDCPQRDERMGWTGDAQAYVGAAAYNADIGAFYTKWLRELMESQRPSGAFPGYAPYPFQHGWDFGTAWADAGVICPWTIWQVYGDTRVIDDCWDPMKRFMDWRIETSNGFLGIRHGNAWGDWLTQGASTPLDYIDTVYFAISAKMMSEMAGATGRVDEAETYRTLFANIKRAFQDRYVREDGSLRIKTQTAPALALFADLIEPEMRVETGKRLAEMLADDGNRMTTGFLGTRPLLPVLTAAGQNDLAAFLFQSHEFPSWGYEIDNGATTIWERWDSYTKEDAFGRHNAAMNSFSHYAFGAVCEWMFQSLAGIRSDGPGYKTIVIDPRPPAPGSNAMHKPIDEVDATYESIRGPIRSAWTLKDGVFKLEVSLPANTTARVFIPTTDASRILEGGNPLDSSSTIQVVGERVRPCDAGQQRVELMVGSGDYVFTAPSSVTASRAPIKTGPAKDRSVNPEELDLEGAELLEEWTFAEKVDQNKWRDRKSLKIRERDGNVYLAAVGQDSQFVTVFSKPHQGKLAIELRARPVDGATVFFFWANAGSGFQPGKSTQRALAKSDQINAYLFAIPEQDPVKQLRFDPFNAFDPYAKANETEIQSIKLYRLAPEREDD